MKLCGACILTNNVLRLAAFYKQVFCSEPVCNEIHSVFDDMQLAIWNPGNIEIADIKNISLMYYVEDADMEYNRLSKIEGISDLLKPVKQRWGVKSFSFKDPDGNEINFLQKL